MTLLACARISRRGLGVERAVAIALVAVLACIRKVEAQSAGDSGRSIDRIDRGAACPSAEAAALERLAANDPVALRNVLRETAGLPIRALHIVSLGLTELGERISVAQRLHSRTRTATVRKLLQFGEGDTVDTLRITESMRRLRRTRFLADAGLLIARCTDRTGVSITIVTHDSWSARPTLKLSGGTAASMIGVEERNLLGSGRAARLYVRADDGRLGVGASYTDPWAIGSWAGATLARNSFRDGSQWLVALHTTERSLLDLWRAELSLSRATRLSLSPRERSVHREAATFLAQRRLFVSNASVTALLVGAESQRTAVAAEPNAALVGPSSVRRSFSGLDIGLATRSLS